MNKYEKLFAQVFAATQQGGLEWKQIKKWENATVIFNPNTVFRQFSSQLDIDGTIFTVLLVEKKHEDPEYEFSREKYVPEVLILHEGELVVSITDSIISTDKLIQLVGLVESKSDKSKKLFGQSKADEILERFANAGGVR